jgi:DtxR family transcriptional regulator, Mn-dependent transcriptional regulator
VKAGQSTVSASLEDYLESIYHIEASNGAARAKDIAVAMKVKNASVTQALRSLSEKNLVNYAPYEVITLTNSGKQIACDVIRRHEILDTFLGQVLGFPKEEADKNACLMEHSVSRPILDRLIKFVEYFQNCPVSKIHWDEDEGYFCGGDISEEDSHKTCGRDICGHKSMEFHSHKSGEPKE